MITDNCPYSNQLRDPIRFPPTVRASGGPTATETSPPGNLTVSGIFAFCRTGPGPESPPGLLTDLRDLPAHPTVCWTDRRTVEPASGCNSRHPKPLNAPYTFRVAIGCGMQRGCNHCGPGPQEDSASADALGLHVHPIKWPPLISMISPSRKDEPGEQRYRIASATSSGFPIRPRGVDAATACSPCGVEKLRW